MNRLHFAALLSIAVLLLLSRPVTAQNAEADEILKTADVHGGFIVHLGCGDGEITAALRKSGNILVHGLDDDPQTIARAREAILAEGLYGPVSVDRLYGTRLPYRDNLVNLLLVSDGIGVPRAEMTRVLAPEGVLLVRDGERWKVEFTKPRPENIDEWTHYMHDAAGNAVAHDDAVGPPKSLQWVGSPRWSRHHDRMASMSALVSAGGRMFYIMDEGSRVSIQLPPKWHLIARDAFNGTILWKREIPKWQNHLWPLKSGPTQLARRLVATRDTVYVTLGIDEPLVALDAATGETLRTYERTKSAEEVIESAGMLFVLANPGKFETADYVPKFGTVGDQRRVREEYHWNAKPRKVVGIEAATGKVLWERETKVAPITLSSSEERVLFHDGEKIVALDRYTGKKIWQSKPAKVRQNVTMNFGPRLVLYDDVVLFAGGNRKMQAYALDDGKELWSADHDPSGYQSPEDLLVSGGLVWSAPTTSGRHSGVMTGRDPKTGEVKQKFAPDVDTYWFHHRCYISKATDKFLMTSRTGIEFVDPEKENWDINHWVRGGCLYGIMPCNGLLYAPPHNCFCYPEAKLYGFNSLSPTKTELPPAEEIAAPRLERGPAYADIPAATLAADDWPTYRHDVKRSGFAEQNLSQNLKPAWKTDLGERLSTVVVADGRLYVAQIDAHTLHALDADTGEKLWHFTTGGRVDSPPTVTGGRVLFGSADGWVYCLRATDGALAWRFRAAPDDRRTMAYEQLESVWPVHGNILVEDGIAYFVAGRSNFLDTGLRWYKLDVATGKTLVERTIDENDPNTGRNIQERLQILQMPVGLPDVLSSDGKEFVFMRSQRFDRDGNRQDLGPHSGRAPEQGAVQGGVGVHLFSPSGFLEGSWFHRSYWVYGKSFAGGHNGYYQAGKNAPAGRILVFDDKNVYGYGRKPEYYRWTTVLEHQLFAASKEIPAPQPAASRRNSGRMIRIANAKSLDPTGKTLTVEAWFKPNRPHGVVIARGGPAQGYALIVNQGKPRFVVRADGKVAGVTAKNSVLGKWVHAAGTLGKDGSLALYVDGKLAAKGKAPSTLTSVPLQATQIGADDGGPVGNYRSPSSLNGLVDEVRVYHGLLTAKEIASRAAGENVKPANAETVLAIDFEKGDAKDASGHKNHGEIDGIAAVKGRRGGTAMQFTGRGIASRGGGTLVKHHWTSDIPLYARAMVLDTDQIFVAGPADIIDEAESFEKLMVRDKQIETRLAQQDAILDGSQGGILQVIGKQDGKTVAEYKLPSVPVWDGLAAAGGSLYYATTDGSVVRMEGE